MARHYSSTAEIVLGFACLFAPIVDAQGKDEDIEKRFVEAQEVLEAGLHDRAMQLYRELLAELEISRTEGCPYLFLVMKARFLLAQTLNDSGLHDEALKLLEENNKVAPPLPDAMEEIRRSSLYLSALTYKQLRQYALAKRALLEYLEPGCAPLSFQCQVQFELALISFLEGSLDEAKPLFSAIQEDPSSIHLHALSQLYLARIALAQSNAGAAMAILARAAQHVPQSDDLHYELSYLQGEACFLMQNYQKAVQYFRNSLPKARPEKSSWYPDTLYRLGWSYLYLAEDSSTDQSAVEASLAKAEAVFQQLMESSPDENAALALGQCYLSRAARLKDENAYALAEALLSRQDLFPSRNTQDRALLLRAEAASSYHVRDKFYRQLTQPAYSSSPFFPKSWYLRALNDFDEGKALLQEGCLEKGLMLLENSGNNFKKAFGLLKDIDDALAATVLKYSALAAGCRENHDASMAAFQVLDELINESPRLLYSLDHPDEIFYLHGFFAARLVQSGAGEEYFTIAKQSLQHAAEMPNSKFGSEALRHLGALQYNREDFAEAECTYLQLARDFTASDQAAEALFWAACCADKLPQGKALAAQHRRLVFENYPESPFAAEAFFTLYSYQDYLQGERSAIKHLHNFTRKFPYSTLLIQSYFLIGLDYKRDRKTAEGKWIRKKSLTEAIDAFQNAETQFDGMLEKSLIPADKLDYYVAVYYRAVLERAMANLAIAEESSGAKRQIYLEYAEEVFKRLANGCATLELPHARLLLHGEAFPNLHEESAFLLAQVYLKQDNDSAAEKVLSEMLERYRGSGTTRGYYLSRVWYEQGRIAIHRSDYAQALHFFKQAEDTAKGNVLGTDQRLDLWIQQSTCHRELGRHDDAILILSKAINDDAISTLRLKAMYLRAEIYELQQRPELARKQLDSLAKKGGIWAQKAKERLKNEYGY